MTEFEAATLAYQNATLAYQAKALTYQATALGYQATALGYQATALGYQYASLWISGGVGATQCLLIGFGLWVMHRSADRRDRQHSAAMAGDARRHEEVMKKHEETMAALEKRHDADARRHEEVMAKHEETMAALDKRHEETMTALSKNR